MSPQALGDEPLETRFARLEEKVSNLGSGQSEIKKMISWGAVTTLAAIVSLLGWSLAQQVAANNQQRDALATQVQILKDRAPMPYPSPSSAAGPPK